MAALLLFMVVTLYFRSVWHVCTGDELRYFYQFHLIPGQTYFHFEHLQAIRSIDDIIRSQINHYDTVNGRIPMHFIEQLFSGVLPIQLFYALNVVVWLGSFLLFVHLTGVGRKRWAVTALISLILWMLLMPEPGRIYTSINLALNYLWPGALSMIMLWMLQNFHRGRKPRAYLVPVLMVVALLAGWSNEGYVFPLSGAMFLYFVCNWRRFRGLTAVLCCSFWAGCALMLSAPGNWLRAAQISDPMKKLESFFNLMPNLGAVWLLFALIAVLLATKRPLLRQALRSDMLLAVCCVFSLMITVATHTGIRSLAPLCLYSSLLFMRILVNFKPIFNPSLRFVWIGVGASLAVFELCATVEHYRQNESVEKVVEAYAANPDGRVVYNYKAPAGWLEPFVYYLPPNYDGSTRYQWTILEAHLNLVNATPGKRMKILIHSSESD